MAAKKAAKKRASRQGNPPDSEWYSTPRAARTRKGIEVMLPDDVREALSKARAATGLAVSVIVEDAIRSHLKLPPRE